MNELLVKSSRQSLNLEKQIEKWHLTKKVLLERQGNEHDLKQMNERVDEATEQLRQQLLYNQQYLEQQASSLHFQQYSLYKSQILNAQQQLQLHIKAILRDRAHLQDKLKRQWLLGQHYQQYQQQQQQYIQQNTGDIGLVVEEQNIINRSNQKAEDIIQVGQQVLFALDSQHQTIKNIKQKVLTLTNQLGLSHSLSKMIHLRNTHDYHLIVIAAILLFLFIAILYYFKT